MFSKPLGGDISPIRLVQDPYPVFYDVAVDPENDLVVASDTNLFSLRTYQRDLLSEAVAEPLTLISGPNTAMDFAKLSHRSFPQNASLAVLISKKILVTLDRSVN